MSAGNRLHIPPVSAEYTALEGKIEHIERVCRLELEQHTRKCRAELTERIDDVVSYIARNLSSDSRNSSARLKDLGSDMATVKVEIRKVHGVKEAVEELTDKMKAMQSDIDALMRRNSSARSRSQARAPTLESVEGHKELKIVIDECLNLTKRVKALERSHGYGSGGNGSSRISHHAAPSEADTEVRTLGEEVRQCLAATVDLRRYIDNSIGKVERRLEASERSSGSPNGLDTMSTVPAVVGPEVTNLQSALEALGEQVAEVKTIREDMSQRLASVEQAVNEFGATNRRADSKSSRLGEGLERNQEQLEILRENLAETRRVVSEAVTADSPQLLSRMTALCEEKVSALADSLLQRPEISERFHRIEAKMHKGGDVEGLPGGAVGVDIAGRYDALTRSLDMLKEVVRQRDERQVEFDGQLREQKANINTATRALAEFKEDLAEMGSLKSRECDELKADLTDMRLSLGSLERRCELKMEEVERRQKRQVEDMIGPVTRQAEEERVRADKGAREEIRRIEGKLEKACRERAEGLEAGMGELVQKGRAEVLAEVHLEIMEVERKVMVKSSREVERIEERLEKMEGKIKRKGSSGGGSRVVTITSSPDSRSSSSEDSYDGMQRDIKYDNICSRVEKLEEIGGRMTRVEERMEEISYSQMALPEEIGRKVDAASLVLRQEIETNRKRGATAVEEMGRLGEQIREVLEERAGMKGELEQMKGDIREGREASLKELEDMRRSVRAGAEEERLVEEIDRKIKGVGAALEEMEERLEKEGVFEAVGRMAECYGRMEEIENRVDSLAARGKGQAEEMGALGLHVDSLDGVKDTLEKSIGKIGDEMGSLRLIVGEVSGLQSTVEEISNFLSKFPRDGFKEDVQRSIEGLRGGLAEVKMEMEEVRVVRQEVGRMGEVESRLGHAEANVEWIEGEMNSYKRSLEVVDGQIAEQGKAMDGLATAVKAVEKEMAERGENKREIVEDGIGGRLQELEDSVTELMALLGVVDELAKNQTEMRKSLQSRCDKQASDLAGELREEMESLREEIERGRDAKLREIEEKLRENEQAGGMEEVKRISEEMVGKVKDVEERLAEIERQNTGGQGDETSVGQSGLAAMKAQIAELEDAVGGAQERVEEMIEGKLEKLQAELVESDSEWQKMVEEQVSAALSHLESEVDPQLTKLVESMKEVMERVRSAEASAGELFGLRKEVGILRRKVEEDKATGSDEEFGKRFSDRIAACEDAIEKSVKCAGEVEGLREALDEIALTVSRHEGALAGVGRSPQRDGGEREREHEATIAEMQKAIQTVHSRMCRLASAIRELYSDCRTSLSNNFPETAASGDAGGLGIPDWSDDSLLPSNQLTRRPPSIIFSPAGSQRTSPSYHCARRSSPQRGGTPGSRRSPGSGMRSN